MQKSIYTIILILFISLGSIMARAEESNPKKSLFAVGLENNRLVFGQYSYADHLIVKLNVSVYSEKIKYQYIRATVGYKTYIKDINLSGEYFFGSSFNGNYYNTGAKLQANAKFFKRLLLDAAYVPWYDSGFGYTNCYEGRIGCVITKHIDIKIGYTNIPEYRMSEERFIGGFDFKVSHLRVSPYLSIGTSPKQGGQNIRVLLGFKYQF